MKLKEIKLLARTLDTKDEKYSFAFLDFDDKTIVGTNQKCFLKLHLNEEEVIDCTGKSYMHITAVKQALSFKDKDFNFEFRDNLLITGVNKAISTNSVLDTKTLGEIKLLYRVLNDDTYITSFRVDNIEMLEHELARIGIYVFVDNLKYLQEFAIGSDSYIISIDEEKEIVKIDGYEDGKIRFNFVTMTQNHNFKSSLHKIN